MQAVTPEEHVEYDTMTESEIDAEIWQLQDRLETAYNTLLAFAKMLASPIADGSLKMAKKLNSEPGLYNEVGAETATQAGDQIEFSTIC